MLSSHTQPRSVPENGCGVIHRDLGLNPLLGSQADKPGLRGQLTDLKQVEQILREPTHFHERRLVGADQCEYPAYTQPYEEPYTVSDRAGHTEPHSEGSLKSAAAGAWGSGCPGGEGVVVSLTPEQGPKGTEPSMLASKNKRPKKIKTLPGRQRGTAMSQRVKVPLHTYLPEGGRQQKGGTSRTARGWVQEDRE